MRPGVEVVGKQPERERGTDRERGGGESRGGGGAGGVEKDRHCPPPCDTYGG